MRIGRLQEKAYLGPWRKSWTTVVAEPDAIGDDAFWGLTRAALVSVKSRAGSGGDLPVPQNLYFL